MCALLDLSLEYLFPLSPIFSLCAVFYIIILGDVIWSPTTTKPQYAKLHNPGSFSRRCNALQIASNNNRQTDILREPIYRTHRLCLHIFQTYFNVWQFRRTYLCWILYSDSRSTSFTHSRLYRGLTLFHYTSEHMWRRKWWRVHHVLRQRGLSRNRRVYRRCIRSWEVYHRDIHTK